MRWREALHPASAARAARARAEAERVSGEAEQDGRILLAQARARADAVLAAAREAGRAEAAALLAAERTRAERAARIVVLEAERELYEELRRRARVAVATLLEDPDRQARLAAAVRARLGADAVLTEQPGGGVVAEAPDGRRIDASVASLVDHALADLDLERLWAVG